MSKEKQGKYSCICIRQEIQFTAQLNNHGCHATRVCWQNERIKKWLCYQWSLIHSTSKNQLLSLIISYSIVQGKNESSNHTAESMFTTQWDLLPPGAEICGVTVVWMGNMRCDSGLCCREAATQPHRCPVGNDKVPIVWQSPVCHMWMVLLGNNFVLGNRIAHVSSVVFPMQKYFPADVMKWIWMSSPGKHFNSFQRCY